MIGKATIFIDGKTYEARDVKIELPPLGLPERIEPPAQLRFGLSLLYMSPEFRRTLIVWALMAQALAAAKPPERQA